MANGVSLANQKLMLEEGTELSFYDSEALKWQAGAAGSDPEAGHPVLVLLHGYCGSSAYWEEVAPMLAQQSRLIIPDLRGHGLSSASAELEAAMEVYADDLYAILVHQRIDKVCLLGHSLGGYIALAFAERYADRLTAFGLVHSTALADSEAAKDNRDNTINLIKQGKLEQVIDGMSQKLFAPDNLDKLPDKVARVKAIGYQTGGTGAIAAAAGMKARPDRTSILREAKLPVLLLAGEGDQIVPPERTLLWDGPSITQVLLKDAGHMSMLEQPEACAKAISSFIAPLTK
ncbi:alpha/beta hydrolase [Paenibacillus sp. FSL H8-0537]|uniref:alpha/beta fold hydrolase n=1 Tax=Paenibacillus sp. FSL H8-0537 TaxID=2921399 RepID=UPI0031018191